MSRDDQALTTEADLKDLSFGEVSAKLTDNKKAKGVVYRKPEARSKWAFCFTFRPGEYTEGELLELIGAEYGPGNYPVVFRSAEKGGKELIRWNEQWEVQARRLGASQTAAPAPAPPSIVGNDSIAIAIDNQSRMMQTIVEKLADIAVTPKTTSEVVKELAAYKELFSTDDKRTLIQQVTDVLELKKMLVDTDDSSTDPLAMALKHLGPAIEKGMEAARQTEQAQAVRRPAAAAPDPADLNAKETPAAEPTGTQDPPPPDLVIAQSFQYFGEAFMPAILQLAEKKTPPPEVATWLVGLIGNNVQVQDLVGRIICQDDMIDRLAAQEPAILEHAHWLDAVADHLAHALWPEHNPLPEAYSATDRATIDVEVSETVITDPETAEGSEDATVGDADARHTDLPRTGDGNDP